ncbi:MAG: hypothetical protein P3X24_005505 [bacterium]|nr:hypothetical protein [bacterium]
MYPRRPSDDHLSVAWVFYRVSETLTLRHTRLSRTVSVPPPTAWFLPPVGQPLVRG